MADRQGWTDQTYQAEVTARKEARARVEELEVALETEKAIAEGIADDLQAERQISWDLARRIARARGILKGMPAELDHLGHDDVATKVNDAIAALTEKREPRG